MDLLACFWYQRGAIAARGLAVSIKNKKSIVCALSLLIGLLSTAPAKAVGWGYNRSYYGGYGRNYYWWPGTWWIPASYGAMILGFPYRYFTQQTPPGFSLSGAESAPHQLSLLRFLQYGRHPAV